MGESFDLTFFSEYSGCALSELYALQGLLNLEKDRLAHSEKHKFPFLSNRELSFTAFHENDYNEYELGVSDVHFTKEKLQEDLFPILDLVDGVFRCCPSVVFATGVYEITDLLIENITCFHDFFKDGALLDFPFLFFRKGIPWGTTFTGEYGVVCYCIQEGDTVQNIF